MTDLNSPEPSNQVSDAMLKAGANFCMNNPGPWLDPEGNEAFCRKLYLAMTQARQPIDAAQLIANAVFQAKPEQQSGVVEALALIARSSHISTGAMREIAKDALAALDGEAR